MAPLCWAGAHHQPSFLLPGPRCPLPFNVSRVAGGAILCEPASGPGGAAVQLCQLLCRRGYRSVFPPGPLVCSLERRRWLSQPPQPQACQREWARERLPLRFPHLRSLPEPGGTGSGRRGCGAFLGVDGLHRPLCGLSGAIWSWENCHHFRLGWDVGYRTVASRWEPHGHIGHCGVDKLRAACPASECSSVYLEPSG